MMNPKHADHKAGRLVVPGDRLGVIEEFVSDSGTFVRDGVIYSMIIGHALPDLATRRIRVYRSGTEVLLPKVGSMVTGQVSNVQPDNAAVRIFQIGDRPVLGGVFVGILHISDVHMRYVDSMFQVCKAGDVLRARVISTRNQTYHLSTKEKDLGVIYGFCSNCGGLLETRRQGMHCSKCGFGEERKIAYDYGKGLRQTKS